MHLLLAAAQTTQPFWHVDMRDVIEFGGLAFAWYKLRNQQQAEADKASSERLRMHEENKTNIKLLLGFEQRQLEQNNAVAKEVNSLQVQTATISEMGRQIEQRLSFLENEYRRRRDDQLAS